jgi:hypothetical protein
VNSVAVKIRVLCFHPSTRPAADVARADALRDDAFKVHPASMTKDGGPVSSSIGAKPLVTRDHWSRGRLKGARNKLGEEFLAELYNAFRGKWAGSN